MDTKIGPPELRGGKEGRDGRERELLQSGPHFHREDPIGFRGVESG